MLGPPDKPRRWFRFSLRTMFVLMALVGAALGWVGVQLKWIRDRNEARAWMDAHDVGGLDLYGWPREAPWSIQIFGEHGTAYFYFYTEPTRRDQLTESDRRRLLRLFPESNFTFDNGTTKEVITRHNNEPPPGF